MWNYLDLTALLLLGTAAFAYVNHFTLQLPRNVGLLVFALGAAVLIRLIEYLGWPGPADAVRGAVRGVDFAAFLLHGILSLLLFAGATEVDFRTMLQRKATIVALATGGVVISTLLLALGAWAVFRVGAVDVPFAWCLVFGALLSPTDPVAVMVALRQVGVREALRAVIEGESLFNDGVGIVLYTMFLSFATGATALDTGTFILTFVREAGGGLLIGAVTGGVAFAVMRAIDDHDIELMISLALATGTYVLASNLEVSGPVAVVVAGLLMGSVGSRYAVSARTRAHLTRFWSMADTLLNGVLFTLIGLELIVIPLDASQLVVAALMIPLAVAVRAVSVAIPGVPLNLTAPGKLRSLAVLTWSGLRGGISVALALSLPATAYRSTLLTATYAVVIFTMVVQGLSLPWAAARLVGPQREKRPQADAASVVDGRR